MSDEYTPREMRLMAERDRALDRAERAEAGFKNVAVVINKGGAVRLVCEDYDVAEAWVNEHDRLREHYYIHVHPVERRRNVRP